MPSDKIILTNISALQKKYGDGFLRVQAAIVKLIAADRKRGLETKLVAIDSEADMRSVKGTAVRSPVNQRQAKAAVDAVCNALQPDYLMILGAPDVVPMQELRNPMEGDGDEVVPSDLPYACAVPFSTDPKAFLGATRVVGRLPDLMGQRNPAYLVRLLGTAARYRSRTASDYRDYFGISAQVWQDSTARSLMKLFGSSANMEISPPRGPKYPDAELARRVHFINCHGSPSDPNFYGQRGKSEFPKAHSARLLPRKISNGTVIAAECCYGAQLYDPSDSRGQPGICSTYLFDGAYGFFGSSTVAYGPSEGNGQADYICQYFIEALLGGASLGRATLEARQRFAAAYTHLDPSDLKTLAQFCLLGDPSVQPVASVPHALSRSKSFKQAFKGAKVTPGARALRRERLVRTGTNLQQTLGAVMPAKIPAGAKVSRVLLAAARDSGLREVTRQSFKVAFPKAASLGELKQFASRRQSRTIHLLIGVSGQPSDKLPQVAALVATVQDGEIIHLRRVHRR
jgi:hypothetical protein